MKQLFSLLWLILFPLSAQSEWLKTKHTQLRLISLEKQVTLHDSIDIALQFKLKPGWHIYWLNPGDAGGAPNIVWENAQTLSAEALRFPAPERINVGDLTSFGFENEVTLLGKLHPNSQWSATDGFVILNSEVQWVVCQKECVPEKKKITLRVKLGSRRRIWEDRVQVFEEARARIPLSVGSLKGTLLRLSQNEEFEFRIENLMGVKFDELDFFPLNRDWIAPSTRLDWKKTAAGATARFIPRAGSKDATLLEKPFVGLVRAGEFSAWVELKAQKSKIKVMDWEFWLAVLSAFIAGVILNLMPCVFPVMTIKLHSFLGERRHSWAYALGIVVTFWALALVAIALRSTGNSVGWGFQMQSAAFVGFLSIVFFLLGFWLLDLLPLGDLTRFLPKKFMQLTEQGGVVGECLSGILTSLAATPCTGPFMGGALAYAFAQGTTAMFSVLTALGLGLASPFLVLSSFSSLKGLLPKPGRWMIVLKGLCAVPLFFTFIWLLTVLIQLGDLRTAVFVLVGGSILGFLIWLRHHLPQTRHWGQYATFAVMIAIPLQATYWKEAPMLWEAFDPQQLEVAVQNGENVFVDVTAQWCITCKANEKFVLERASMQSFFKESKVRLMKADWTNADPQVTEYMSRYGRSSVPLYVVYTKGKRSGEVLPQILTQGIVAKAFSF